MCCGECHCAKCQGVQLILLGALILLNIYVLSWSWWMFVGVILILAGFSKVVMPICPCNRDRKMAGASSVPRKGGKKKKRR